MTQNLQYKVGIKQQFANALRRIMENIAYPDPDIARKLHVELEYPIEREIYPAIYIGYIEREIYNAGLGHYTLEADDAGIVRKFRHWIFTGSLSVNIMALDPLERDHISAQFVNAMAFSRDDPLWRQFRDEIYDEDFVSLQLLTDQVYAGTDSISPSPWQNKNEFVYISSYSLPCLGSFFTEPTTSDLIQITKVPTYPYRAEDPLPQGSQDPLDQGIPWSN